MDKKLKKYLVFTARHFDEMPSLEQSEISIFIQNILLKLYGKECQKPDCKKRFITLTSKERRYCSAACLMVMSQRIKRECLKKHPVKYKAYLKKMKELMQERRKMTISIYRNHP